VTERNPANLVVVLLDSLNRHLLEAYGHQEFETPCLRGFSQTALRFAGHHAGSLPCMPARHDILVGALDFPWRPWGSIEIWEDAITRALRDEGVTTMLVSDHPHLFETGGENYHTDFTAWAYERGHESDPWRTTPDPTWAGAPALPAERPRYHHAYDDSRTYFRAEEDFPGPRTMSAAADWIRTSAGSHDRFFLMVDEFDPHEPFDTPLPYARMYGNDREGALAIWPPYLVDAISGGHLDPTKARQIRNNYGAKLTMIDHWFGRLVVAFVQAGLSETTGVIVCTDHGHYLGEHDLFGKPDAPIFSELGRIPLLVRWPGQQPRDIDALTTSVDLHATIADVFGASVDHPTHGRSLVPLIEGRASTVRELALFGYWGRHVGITDGRHRYLRGSGPDNFPLSIWSNRWSTMPIPPLPQLRLPRPDRRATLQFMPGTDVPVICQPFEKGDRLPFWAGREPPSDSYLFDTATDPDESENRVGEAVEGEMLDAVASQLRAIGAPADLLHRIGVD
jgi:arylsulfatase A-like enzyme